MIKHRFICAIHAFKDGVDWRSMLNEPIPFESKKVIVEEYEEAITLSPGMPDEYAKHHLCESLLEVIRPHITYKRYGTQDTANDLYRYGYCPVMKATLKIGFIDEDTEREDAT